MASILIIDDSSFQRRAITRMVKAAGYETLDAANGQAGLEIANTQSPDCILVDLLMPEMDGIQVLQALRAQSLHIPVIVLTADIQESVREQCLELGAKAFINKPPKADMLCGIIEEALK